MAWKKEKRPSKLHNTRASLRELNTARPCLRAVCVPSHHSLGSFHSECLFPPFWKPHAPREDGGTTLPLKISGRLPPDLHQASPGVPGFMATKLQALPFSPHSLTVRPSLLFCLSQLHLLDLVGPPIQCDVISVLTSSVPAETLLARSLDFGRTPLKPCVSRLGAGSQLWRRQGKPGRDNYSKRWAGPVWRFLERGALSCTC